MNMIKLLEALGLTPTWNADMWKSKMSTWLSLLQACGGAMLIAWFTLGDKIQDAMPQWVLIAFGGFVVVVAGLTVLAANTSQRRLAEKRAEKITEAAIQKATGVSEDT